MDRLVDVTVRGLAAGGAGVADLPDGRVVFVPRTAPGDRARIRVDKSKPRWAEGSLVSLPTAGPSRREPLCSLFDRCGGCQLQHVSYAAQLEWKGRFVADALGRIGRLQDIEPPEVVPSPFETGYRTRVTFTLRRVAGRVIAGFHELGRASRVVDVAGECILPRPEIVSAWEALRSAWGPGARLLPAGGRLRLTLRSDGGRISLVVEGGPRGWTAEPLARAVAGLDAIWHSPGGDDQAVPFGGEPTLAYGEGVEALTPSFTQVNPEAAALLVAHVDHIAGKVPGRAVDAYCGLGDYGRVLVARGWAVTGIERDGAACAAARATAPERLEVLEGRVEDLLPTTLPADLVIVNPPRSGLSPEVTAAVLDGRPPRLIYVSCDPATLGRDARALSDAFDVVTVRCFDLFPQTAHVETVLELARKP